jgi:hypothetical protein
MLDSIQELIMEHSKKLIMTYGEVVEKHNQECLLLCIPPMKQPVTYNKIKWRGIKIDMISRRDSQFSELKVFQRGKQLGKTLFIRINYDKLPLVFIESYTEP